MKRLTFYIAFLGVVIMSVIFSSCTKEPITSWNSPRMLTLKRQWDELLKTPTQTWGRKNENLNEMQQKILDNLSTADMRCLAATCDTLPVHEKDPNAFEINVLQHMVRKFIHAGDRDSLVTLFSTRFPIYLYAEMTTTYALLHLSKNTLKDPILILGEAYSRCKVPEVRHDIAEIVRDGFQGFDIPGKDDAEFVKNAMQWYENNKSHLTVRVRFSAKYPGTFFEDDRETEN